MEHFNEGNMRLVGGYTESLTCLIRRDGEEGHHVRNNHYGGVQLVGKTANCRLQKVSAMMFASYKKRWACVDRIVFNKIFVVSFWVIFNWLWWNSLKNMKIVQNALPSSPNMVYAAVSYFLLELSIFGGFVDRACVRVWCRFCAVQNREWDQKRYRTQSSWCPGFFTNHNSWWRYMSTLLQNIPKTASFSAISPFFSPMSN